MRTGSRDLIRDLNAAIVLRALRDHQPVARVALADHTGLSRAAITAITARLIAEGWIHEAGSQSVARGRSRTLLRLDPSARFCVGVQVSPDSITVAVTDLEGSVQSIHEASLSGDPESVLPVMEEAIAEGLRRAHVRRAKLAGIGVASSGIVDSDSGVLIHSPFHDWSRLPVRAHLHARFRVPVHVDNDANAFALSEYTFGAGKGHRSLVGVTLGAGIGAGLLLQGRLYRGALYAAGEVGHMTVDPDGPVCSCGKRGCLEALAGDVGIARDAEAITAGGAGQAVMTLAGTAGGIHRRHVVAAARCGDADALGVLRRAAVRIGLGLSWVVQMVNPDAVILGGELFDDAGDLIRDPIEAVMRDAVGPDTAGALRVLPGALGHMGWLLGGVAMVLDDVFRLPVVATERSPDGTNQAGGVPDARTGVPVRRPRIAAGGGGVPHDGIRAAAR